MSIPLDQKMGFETIMNYILRGAQDALKHFTGMTKKWLTAYFLATMICTIMDLVQFFNRLPKLHKAREAFSDLSLILLAVIFIFINFYYVLWMISLFFKFPQYVNSAFLRAILGAVEDIHYKLGNLIQQRKTQAASRYASERMRYNYIQEQNLQV